MTATAFLEEFRPHVVFVMGDVLDAYSLSKFDKNPERLLGFQEELDKAYVVLSQIRQAAKQAKIVMLRGNHEARLTRYLWTKAEALSSLRDLSLPLLMRLTDMKIDYVEKGRTDFHGFIVKHGTVVRKKSGYTAMAELERQGTSGVSAHTHRLGQVYLRNDGGFFSWTESGCLCLLDPEYADGETMNWQHGLAYGYFKANDGRFEVHPLPIIKRKIVWEGQEITP